MVLYFFIICVFGNVQVQAMQEGEEANFELEHKGEESIQIQHKVFYPSVSHEMMFLRGLSNYCAKKTDVSVKKEGEELMAYIIKNDHEILARCTIQGKLPLAYAFGIKNFELTSMFARAERDFFLKDDAESQNRLDMVLYDAVKEQECDMVELLLKHGASTACKEGYDVLLQLIINCSAERQKSPGCCFRRASINPLREESAYRIAQLLVRYRAYSLTASRMAAQLNCSGRGCQYIKNLGVIPSAPSPE